MTGVREAWVPTQTEFDAFAGVSGDDNPIHVDPDFSARTKFGRTVSHGMLIFTKLWGLLQRQHPGARLNHQSLMFPNPTFVDDRVTLVVRPLAEGRYLIEARRDGDDAVLLTGEATVDA